jgi:hypothetical protein
MALMALFERTLEVAAWDVLELDVRRARPFTDKVGISNIVERIRKREKTRGGSLGAAIDLTCEAADDLIAYRNEIAHGWLLAGPGEMPYFASNVAWHGEQRGRPFQDAHISENLLDLAVDSALVLVGAARGIFLACSGPDAFDEEAMRGQLDRLHRARSQASELRHLRALMGIEKY